MPVATQRVIATWAPAGIYMQYLFWFAWHVLWSVYFYAACCFLVLILMYLFFIFGKKLCRAYVIMLYTCRIKIKFSYLILILCPLNYDVRVCYGKTRDFIIDMTIYGVRLFEVSVFERKVLLRNIRKIYGTFKSVRAIHSVRPIRVWLSEV
jgi:hypothetical protein